MNLWGEKIDVLSELTFRSKCSWGYPVQTQKNIINIIRLLSQKEPVWSFCNPDSASFFVNLPAGDKKNQAIQ